MNGKTRYKKVKDCKIKFAVFVKNRLFANCHGNSCCDIKENKTEWNEDKYFPKLCHMFFKKVYFLFRPNDLRYVSIFMLFQFV